MAVGEAACVSVHGANRLGSNSLLDLVVFGREAARRCARARQAGHRARAAAEGCRRAGGRAARPLRNAKGSRPTAAIRLEMQKSHADRCGGIPHRRESCSRACSRLARDFRVVRATCGCSDRSLIWNTDLVETMELENLLLQATATIHSAEQPPGKPRRACARGLPADATTRNG